MFDSLPIEKKQKLLRLLTETISVEILSPHWVKLHLNWIGAVAERPDICLVWRTYGATGKIFEDWEYEVLKEYYPTGAQRELMQRLPTRTWQSILTGVSRKLQLKREVKDFEQSIPSNACWKDLEVIGDMDAALQMVAEGTKAQAPLYPFWTPAHGNISDDNKEERCTP